MSDRAKEYSAKVLVLCVDRDDDIGVKGEIATPIIGRDNNLRAAMQLAVKDPEESDSNAIFGAIRTYDALKSEEKEDEYEVATIAGSELGGVKADRKLSKELEEVLTEFPANKVVLVTDGFADETVIPIIQSRLPIMSIRRIVVRHSESIEETYALFFRYFKKLFKEPYYARIALGLPGIILIILVVFWYLNLLLYAGWVFLFIFGAYLCIKGFGIDRKISSLSMPGPPVQVKLLATIAAMVIIGLGFYQTYLAVYPVVPSDPSRIWSMLPFIIGLAVNRAIDLIVIAVCLVLIGRGIYYALSHSTKVWRNILGVIVCIWIREIAFRASIIMLEPTPPTSIFNKLVLDLLLSVLIGITITVILILIAHRVSTRFEAYFKTGVKKS